MDKIKTAAYCRVSTDKETQDGSYELQESYFTELISADPHMELVGIYGDKGKSGLYADKRPGLQKLMDDCRAGKINLILTKSISRFARNMAECAEMIRELRSLGVNIIFEEQNLNSQDTKCDLVLNIFAAIAEEESHSISQHALQAHEQHTMEGRPFGLISFSCGNIRYILKNETYRGDKLLQKTHPKDLITKKPDPRVEFESNYLSEDHEAIVSKAVWDAVQAKLKKNKEFAEVVGHRGGQPHFLYGKVFCGECGAPMTRRTVNGPGGGKIKIWVCREKRKGSGCGCRNVKEEELLKYEKAARIVIKLDGVDAE